MDRNEEAKVDAWLRSKPSSPDLVPAVLSRVSQPLPERRYRARWGRVVIAGLALVAFGACGGYLAASRQLF